MSKFKNVVDGALIFDNNIVHPGTVIEVADERDAEVAAIQGFEMVVEGHLHAGYSLPDPGKRLVAETNQPAKSPTTTVEEEDGDD